MKLKDSDAQILQHIVNYCNQIKATIDLFGDNEKIFLQNFIYRNAVSMPVLQIGELVNHLSTDFTAEYNQIAWREIVGMRNHFAHGYQIMNFSEVWNTAMNDVPMLNSFCKNILRENNFFIPEQDNFAGGLENV